MEIAAPAGYNRLTTPVTVTIDPTYNDGDRTSTYVDGHVPDATLDQLTAVTVNGGTAVTVINLAGAILPETGGMGTKLFTIGGLTMILLALILVTVRRKSADKRD